MPVEVQCLFFESCVLNKPTEHCLKVNLTRSTVDEFVGKYSSSEEHKGIYFVK